MKLFFIDCRRVEEKTQQLSTLGSIPTIKGTMKIHQVVCTSRGMLTYRDGSCVCSAAQGKLDCVCHQPKAFRIEAALLPTQDRIPQHDPVIRSDGGHEIPDVEAAGNIAQEDDEMQEPSADISGVATFSDSPAISRPDTISLDHIGKHYVVLYDEKPYPGIILDVDDDGDVQIKCMASL